MNIKANRDVFDEMENNAEFKGFVGKALSHFINLVEGSHQVYEVPDGLSEVIWPEIWLLRDGEDGTIYITEDGNIDE